VKVVLALMTAACMPCLLMVTGCHKSVGTGYWPMAAGNLWLYRSMQITAPPDSAPDTLIIEDEMTWKCVEQVTLDSGTTAWAMCTGYQDTSYFVETGNAVLWYSYRSQTDPDTWLSLPLEEGKNWTYAGSTMLVREKGTVEVPAGTFEDCWKVEMLGGGGEPPSFVWFAPNVGMVLLEVSYQYGGYTFTMRKELSYNIIQ
jgi:hypothetical protein